MKINFSHFCIIILICFPIFIWGQTDTILQVPEVVVNAPKIRGEIIGGNSKTWNEDDIISKSSNNVGELLQRDGGIFIKSYGMGSLATSSIRGGNSSHTLILWNGLPIQSPMLGLLDLSLLPLNSTSEITLQKGGNSAMWGSGAIGGVISMKNSADFSNQLSVSLLSEVGSFGFLNEQIELGIGNSRFQSVSKVFYQEAENDFFHPIHPTLPERQQTNAAFSRKNILQDFYWKINQKNKVNFHFWKQWSSQEIPPTIVQNINLAHQDDRSTRMILEWDKIMSNGVIRSKVGYFDEYNIYFFGAGDNNSNNHFTNYFIEVESQWNLKSNQKLVLGATNTLMEATSPGYPNDISENRFAAFASYLLFYKNWKVQSSIRQTIVDGNFNPILPTLGIEYDPFSNLNFKFKVSKNYRLPTLNDRFWVPGGNPELLPESGWSQELSVTSKFKKGNFNTNFQVTAFNRYIDNWILWALNDGDFYWSAVNVEKVWSRGLESLVSFNFQKNDFQMQLDLSCNYIRSTSEFDLALPKIKKGTQLFYTPKFQAFSKLIVGWKNFRASYQHAYMASTLGLIGTIDPYFLGNFNLDYQLKKGKFSSIFFLGVNNIWDTDYYIIERRPIPGRHYKLGIKLNFNHKSKSH